MNKPKFSWFYVASHYTDNGKEVFDEEFKPLEEDAIKEHIEILNRHLEMKREAKKRKAA